jgi:hypothetical protein
MKNNLLTLLGLCLFSICSCNKSENDKPSAVKIAEIDNDAVTPVCKATIATVDTIPIFPADNSWNQDISKAKVDTFSNQIIAKISTSGLHPDFGSGLYDGAPIGIPFVVVCGSQPKVKVTFRANSYDGDYGTESDPGPYPIPLNAPIEGNGQGDSHVIVIDDGNNMLYELYNASVTNGAWGASSGAIFNLRSDKLRPWGWTSADAAGLPIFPGLVRYDEVLHGWINHAIRFTLSSQNVKPAFIAPARHKVNSTGGQYSLPFGAKMRLKASFDITKYSAANQVILKAMKRYGIILADIGSNMYISGAPDSRWNNNDLHNLGYVKAADFEVVSFH